jgi:hypothetical protein
LNPLPQRQRNSIDAFAMSGTDTSYAWSKRGRAISLAIVIGRI